MAIRYSKNILSEKFYSTEMDTSDFKKLIEDIIKDTDPDDQVESIKINDGGLVDIKLKSGKEIEIEVDWSELILK